MSGMVTSRVAGGYRRSHPILIVFLQFCRSTDVWLFLSKEGMHKITLADFEELFKRTHSPSISIYFSTDDAGLEATKRKALLQNNERTVMEQLQKFDMPEMLVKQVAHTFALLRDDDVVWEVSQKSLAIFVSPDFYRVYQLPIKVKSFVHVSSRFHLKPLIRLVAESSDFYILSLAKKSVTLFQGDRYSLKKIQLPDLPQTMEEVVGVETSGRHLQFHTGTATPRGSDRPASFHGQSSPWKDDKQRYVRRFLQAIDKVITDYLENTKAPLLLSGVERMLTTYWEIATYPQVVPELCLKGNGEEDSLTLLHELAFECLEPYFMQQEKDEVESVMDSGNRRYFSLELDEILREAHLGRVDKVMVAQGIREWGQFDPKTLAVTYADETTPETHDLLDTVCAVTLMNGGKAYVLPPEEMPNHQEIVALFRYPPPGG